MKTQKTKTTNDTTIEITTITTSCSSYSDDSNTGNIQQKSITESTLRQLKKISNSNMHVMLRWLKFRRESEFEVLNASNFEPSQDFRA